MSNKPKIYDIAASNELPLGSLLEMCRDLGAERVIYKSLSPNDNSKNQPYLGGHLTDLGFLPTGEITESASTSTKTRDPRRQIKYTAALDLFWLSPTTEIYHAPDAKLIYYPQYPEVRLSGFVARAGFDMGGWMDPAKKGRMQGRVLFLGITASGKIFAYLATPESRIAKEINDFPSVSISGVFNEIEFKHPINKASSKDILLAELKRIHDEGWIESKRLDAAGNRKSYRAQNGGGYTLEAELGVIPNGIADPDFLGWEIKQFSVKKCHLINSKALTVMTPEPNGGYYFEYGAEAFVRNYGYTSEENPDRYDFTGRHFSGQVCEKSGLILSAIGYDPETDSITDAAGFIGLLDKEGKPLASWSFAKLMEHWKRKHAKAAYIPSLTRNESDKSRFYSYCNNIRLFQGTSINQLLKAITSQHVYYDPGINLKNAGTKPVTKRRSQFRIKSSGLFNLYNNQEDIDL